MSDPDADLEARRRALDARIEQAHQSVDKGQPAASRHSSDESALGRALRYSAEFIGGVIGGSLLGYGIDWLLGSLPLGLITGLVLGFATGMYNLLRVSELDRKAGQAQASDTRPGVDTP
jgi:ATP synthase protein I